MNPFPNNNHSILESSLFELCNKKASGTLFILTNCNRSAEIVIEKGEITDLSFDNKKGMSSIPDLMDSMFKKTHYIKDYYFPLTKAAKVNCSETILRQLGYYKHFTEINRETYSVAV